MRYHDRITEKGKERCLEKKRYSRKGALKAARQFNNRPYKCIHCGHFHLSKRGHLSIDFKRPQGKPSYSAAKFTTADFVQAIQEGSDED